MASTPKIGGNAKGRAAEGAAELVGVVAGAWVSSGASPNESIDGLRAWLKILMSGSDCLLSFPTFAPVKARTNLFTMLSPEPPPFSGLVNIFELFLAGTLEASNANSGISMPADFFAKMDWKVSGASSANSSKLSGNLTARKQRVHHTKRQPPFVF